MGSHLSGAPNTIRSPGVGLFSRPEEQRELAPILLTIKAVKPPAAAIAAWILALTKARPRAPNSTKPVTTSQPATASRMKAPERAHHSRSSSRVNLLVSPTNMIATTLNTINTSGTETTRKVSVSWKIGEGILAAARSTK